LREFKSFNINFEILIIGPGITVWIFIILSLIEDYFPGSLNNIPDEIKQSFLPFIVVLIISSIILSLNFIIVNNRGIEIRTLFPRITLKKRSWREIKYYAHVIETWSGKFNFSDWKVIWFIDFDDKVCIRVPRRASFNLKNVMKEVSKFEDKFEIELKFRDPIFTARGYKKVEYPKDLNKNEKKIV
tara:strand:- start:1 stop:558 length:558 start_codon:yes stop_codon:yes gene_type:complete